MFDFKRMMDFQDLQNFSKILETEIAQQQKELGDAYMPRKTYLCFWRLKLELVCLISPLSSLVSRGAMCKTSYLKQARIQFWPRSSLEVQKNYRGCKNQTTRKQDYSVRKSAYVHCEQPELGHPEPLGAWGQCGK